MVYAASLNAYINAGWPGVLPVPHEQKYPPPAGYTGEDGAWPSPLDYSRWSHEMPGHDIALRMPPNVAVLDIDHYVKNGELKEGAEQLDLITARCGPLPPTWASTARGMPDGTAGPSRQLFYRIRSGTKFPGNVSADIDILQRHHRYAVVAPSVHTSTGRPYCWYRPDGSLARDGEVPVVDELPLLPKEWAGYLAHPDPALAGRRTGSGYRGSHGVRGHDDELAALAFGLALQGLDETEIYDRWCTAAAEHTVDPSWPYADHDFRRHMRNVPEKTAAIREEWRQESYGWARMFGCVTDDECEQWLRDFEERVEKGEVPRTAVDEDTGQVIVTRYQPPGPLDFVAAALPRNAWGYPEFDPQGATDQDLAEQVLAAFYPSVRYAEDTGDWLERRADRWVTRGKGTLAWMISSLVRFMPAGEKADGKPEDLTPFEAAQDARYRRRMAFKDTARSSAIAAKAGTLVFSSHPSTCRLDELDTEAEILWAGGVPWDLRKSTDGPVRAGLPEETAHMRTARYVPGSTLVPTPLWDAVTAAVWPDQELRHWALRVLSITLTGRSTADIPLLVGGAGRGKSAISELLLDLLGDYGHKAARELLDPAHKDPHAEYGLKGRRLAFIDEAPQPGRNRQAKLKDLTGGTRRQGRQLYKDFVEFTPTHTIVMTANRGDDDPILSDEAIRRRVRLIPCEGDKDAVDTAMDPVGYSPFSAAWQAEAPHVLARMMAEAAAYLADPRWHLRCVPTASGLMEAAIKHDQNTVLQWVLAETDPWEAGTEASVLHAAYSQWCKDHGEFAEKLKGKFGTFMREALACEPRMNVDGRMVYPVRVRASGLLTAREFMRGGDSRYPAREPNRDQGAPREPGDTVSVRVPPAETPPFTETQRPTLVKSKKEEEEENKGYLRGTEKVCFGSLGYLEDPLTSSGSVFTEETVSGYGECKSDPVVPEKSLLPENGENGKIREKPDSPPKRKNPGSRLTPEEKAERETARKAKLAQARLDARAAKTAELGGPLVKLPAVVLRDQTVLETDAETASAFLEPVLGELSVDVEHSGFPRQHKDYCLRLVQLGGEHFAVVLDPSDPAQADVIRKALRAAKVLHAHSALADLVPLEAAGLGDRSMWTRMRDTVLAAKLTDPALCDSDEVGLKALAKKLLGPDYALSWKADELRKEIFAAGGWLTETEVTTPVERSGWAQVSLNTAFVRYAASDVMDCAAVWRVLAERSGRS